MSIIPWFWHLANSAAKVVTGLRLSTRVSVEGPIPAGGVLVCAKHASGFDIPVLADLGFRLRRSRPYFQMGSFVGYPVLGLIVPFLRRLGGFCVMRPKEVFRLRHRKDFGRERALARMAEVNALAERTRADLLREGEMLVVFPEGTRDDARLRPLDSDLEVRSAVRLRAEGVPVQVWPVVLSFGPRRFFRRRLEVVFLPPFDPVDLDADAILARVAGGFASRWTPPVPESPSRAPRPDDSRHPPEERHHAPGT